MRRPWSRPAAAHIGLDRVSTLQAFQGSRPLPFEGMQISTMGDAVVAIDTSTGETRWTHALEGNARREGGALGTPPVLAGGQLLVATLTGEVRVLDPRTGRQVKSYGVGHPVRSQPVVHEGWIYLGTTNGRLVGFDTQDPSLTGWTHWGADAARTGLASL